MKRLAISISAGTVLGAWFALLHCLYTMNGSGWAWYEAAPGATCIVLAFATAGLCAGMAWRESS